jgi:uncharacterized protein YjbI with pentapeptide repeats
MFYADFTGATLQSAKLNHCNLRGANLSHANLQGADTQNANLEGIVLTEDTRISIEQLKAALSCEYAFSWNTQVSNEIFSQMHQGQLDVGRFPQPLDGGNWSLARFLGKCTF